jgi:hypothetical protein
MPSRLVPAFDHADQLFLSALPLVQLQQLVGILGALLDTVALPDPDPGGALATSSLE